MPIAERDYLIAHKTKQSSAVAQAYGSAYPAKNMLENQLAALACTDWGDFRTWLEWVPSIRLVEGQIFGNYSDGLALKELQEATNHVDWSLHYRPNALAH